MASDRNQPNRDQHKLDHSGLKDGGRIAGNRNDGANDAVVVWLQT